jgi:uncharacterized protein YbdZ (MbtH family)
MPESKWQWIDNTFGPMGWFTDAEKAEHDGKPDFINGHWRQVPPEEVADQNAWLGRLTHEQS